MGWSCVVMSWSLVVMVWSLIVTGRFLVALGWSVIWDCGGGFSFYINLLCLKDCLR